MKNPNERLRIRLLLLDLIIRYRNEKRVMLIDAYEACEKWAEEHFGVVFPSYPSMRNFQKRNKEREVIHGDTEICEIFAECQIIPVSRVIVEEQIGMVVKQTDKDGRKDVRLDERDQYVSEDKREYIERLRKLVEEYEAKRPHQTLAEIQADCAKKRSKSRRDFDKELSGH